MRKIEFQPLLTLVDFDGCVNVLQPSPVFGFVQAELDGYTLQADPVVLAGLDYVIVNCNLMPAWASMWGRRAPEAGRRLGIGADWAALQFDYPQPDDGSLAFLTDVLDGVAELKLPIVTMFVGDKPFIWIDDDITPKLQEWAARRNRETPTLLVKPNPRVGVTVAHLEELIRFAHTVQAWRQGQGPSSTSPKAA